MMRRLRFGVILLALVSSLSPVWAQEQQALILLRREISESWAAAYGNLYAYTPGDDAPTPLTTDQYIAAPALSPDGGMIAYAAVAESTLQEASDGDYSFSPDHANPMDIWLMNTRSHAAIPITHEAAYRSNPVWSPDGNQLAWFTWDGAPNGGSIVVYDRSTGEETTLASGLMMNPNDIGAFTLANVVGWGETIAHIVKQGDDSQRLLMLETAGENGMVRQQVIANTDYLPRIVWAKADGKWWVAFQDMDDQWRMVGSDGVVELTTPPLLQLRGGDGARLKPVSSGWEILPEDGEAVAIPYEGVAVIAPDGEAVAHLREQTAYLWQGGQELVPLLPDEAAEWQILSLLWSPMEWVI
ncbi:MAG: hypothetical protein LCI00_18905 [Chloroflexi bacterium]|nr:hypothetical protein [Chloroflexota bacterium]MCC6894584.1 PD40 domain-containing protein [Anaerolineae bacterium]